MYGSNDLCLWNRLPVNAESGSSLVHTFLIKQHVA